MLGYHFLHQIISKSLSFSWKKVGEGREGERDSANIISWASKWSFLQLTILFKYIQFIQLITVNVYLSWGNFNT